MRAATKPWCYIPVNPKYRAKIDKEDFKRVTEYNWRVIKKPSGRLRVITSFTKNGKIHKVSLGQFLMKAPKNKMVYTRRFMEELDFRKSNLIVCTMSERQKMLPKSRRFGSSKFKGVSAVENGKKWRAQIHVKGIDIGLGTFRNQIEAARAYNEASKKYFGEFGYQNVLEKRSGSRRKSS